MEVTQPITVDLLDTSAAPALASTSDMPVVEVKPDATPAAREPEPAPADEDEGETHSESATEPADEPAASDEPRKAKGVQKRLDELVKQREEERAEKLRLLALVEELQRGHKPEVKAPEPEPEGLEPEPVEPNRLDFEDLDAYDIAIKRYAREVAEWSANNAIAKARREAEENARQRQIEEGQRKAVEQFSASVEAVKAKYADFESVAYSPEVSIPTAVAVAIQNTPNAGELLYYFGKNPQEAQRLYTLNPYAMLMELGRIEGKLTAAPEKPPAVSAAPRPIKPIAPSGDAQVKKSPHEESMEEYYTRRKAELRAEARGARH